MKANIIETTHRPGKSLFRFWIIILFLSALAVRMGFAFFSYKNNTVLAPDSHDYIRLANSLVESFSYGLNSSEIFRVPLYPGFLSLIKFITPSAFISAALILQSFLDSLSTLMIFFLTAKLFKFNHGKLFFPLISGFLYAFSPLAITCSSLILSETLFNFILLLFLIAVSYIGTDRKAYLLYFVIGLLMSALTFTRVVFIPLSFLFVIFIFFKTKNFKAVLICAFSCYAILFAWSLRNYIYSGYAGISTVSAINTYRYNACALEAQINKKAFNEVQTEFDSKLTSFKTQNTQAHYAVEEGWKIIMGHPFKYSLIHFRTSLSSLLPASGDLLKAFGYKIGDSGTLAVINSEGICAGIKHYFAGDISLFLILLPLTILLGIEYVLSILGGITIFSLKNNESLFFMILMLLSALYFIFVGGPASTPRFRLPAEPIISLFASYGLYKFSKLFYRKNNG